MNSEPAGASEFSRIAKALLAEPSPEARRALAARWIRESSLHPTEIETVLGAIQWAFSQWVGEATGASAVRRCSFCHKTQREVRILVAATQASICDECVDIASETVSAKAAATERSP